MIVRKDPLATTQRFRVALLASVSAALITAAGASGQSGGTTPPPEAPPPPAPAPAGGPKQVFPLPGPHVYRDGFGAGRNHQGADIFADCGDPEVAVATARVVVNSFHASAGNYVVLRSKKLRRDFVYMHMVERSPLRKKQKVVPGQVVGAVGDTGNASGCHLHFEMWKGKWYRGGKAIDPVPSLKAWDAYS